MRRIKGQLGGIENAPAIILVVGLTFLVMATIALIGQKYGDAIPSSKTNTTINETLTTVTEQGEYIQSGIRASCNFEDFAVTRCINATSGTLINTTTYTVGEDGKISATIIGNLGSNNSNWKCTYTYSYAGVACEVNRDLETEISNNTSIAGIVLTISLVGIVLTILIGVFLGMRRQRI